MTTTIARVPAALVKGKPLPERVRVLTTIAAPFADLLPDRPLAWRYERGEFRLETIPCEET